MRCVRRYDSIGREGVAGARRARGAAQSEVQWGVRMWSWQVLASLAATVALVVGTQLLFKWQVLHAGPMPDAIGARAGYLFALLRTPAILAAFACGFLAALFWLNTLARLDLSLAYPIMSLTFPFVLLASVLLFGEPMTWQKVAATGLIVAGLSVHASG